MILFWQISRRAFQRQLAYRMAVLINLLTNLLYAFTRASVIAALYGTRQDVAGLSIEAAITYVGLTEVMVAYLSIFGWYEIIESVYSGEISSVLLKPLGLFRFWLARDVGRTIASLILQGLGIGLIYALFFNIILPTSLLHGLIFVLSLISGLLVSFAWNFLVNLSAFWTPDATGIGRFAFGLSWVLSGFFLPLRLFPAWFVKIAHFTPFPAMINTSLEIYLGLLTGPDLIRALIIQILWSIVLIVLGQVILRIGIRRLIIQGG